jgi:hypothetical protein
MQVARTTLHNEAVEVPRAAGGSLHVNEIWKRIARRGFYRSASLTPEQSLMTQLLRKTPGVQVSAATDQKLFSRDGPNVFGLLEWRSQVRLPEEVVSGSTDSEGSVHQILVNRYERDRQAREKCIRRYGTTCHLCAFDFVAVYGEVMADFIHVHHLKLLSSVGPDYVVDPIRDLRPVCPNCHAVLHRREPPYSLDDVRRFLHTPKG